MDAIFPLKGVVKKYDWGGTTYIPNMLCEENKGMEPFAEYWMGVHAQGIASVQLSNGKWVPLTQLAPDLSFLLKVLDVRGMLSIQVHPNKTDAQVDFERENKMGIPLDSPIRNYKDNNHKPELMVALSEFWLLHGFKSGALLIDTLRRVAEFQPLISIFEQGGYRELYRTVMEMPQDEADHLLIPLRDRLLPLYEKGELKKTEPDFWAARAFLTFSPEGHADRGIFSVYFFNLVSVEPGQALFQDAGIPHAYLEGQNVEIMANSDNVLRGGLTTKHIAVDELLKHVLCIPVQPAVQSPSLDSEYWFTTKVDDFRLGQIKLNRGEQLTLQSDEPSMLLCLDGEVELVSNERSLILKPGQPSAFWQKGSTLQLKALTDCRIFRANTGFHTR